LLKGRGWVDATDEIAKIASEVRTNQTFLFLAIEGLEGCDVATIKPSQQMKTISINLKCREMFKGIEEKKLINI
jgi:hypothetical protein